MDQRTKEIIESWPWRITKSGKTMTEFSQGIIGVDQSLFSRYINFKVSPSPDRIKHIEQELKKLGV